MLLYNLGTVQAGYAALGELHLYPVRGTHSGTDTFSKNTGNRLNIRLVTTY